MIAVAWRVRGARDKVVRAAIHLDRTLWRNGWPSNCVGEHAANVRVMAEVDAPDDDVWRACPPCALHVVSAAVMAR